MLILLKYAYNTLPTCHFLIRNNKNYIYFFKKNNKIFINIYFYFFEKEEHEC